MATTAHGIRLDGVGKVYHGGAVAVRDLSLDILAGEFFSLLGPSGCGKTTTLRMIAGFEDPTSGRLLIDGQDVTAVPPHKRDTGMVFQSYALFPHRTVLENVGFGLKMRRVPIADAVRRARRALAMVELQHLQDRYPAQLSGGQQQRVALARAIVIEPKVLLMDEPLGALDKRLRRQMQVELKALQRQVGITLVYVTHDQEEALTMSDRIAVMDQGRLQQVGVPEDIYHRPRTAFVSDFIGDSNLLSGKVEALALRTATGDLLPLPDGDWQEGQRLTMALRPERIALVEAGGADGTIESASFTGAAILYRVGLPRGEHLLVRHTAAAGAPRLEPGTPVRVAWEPEAAVLLDAA